MPISLSTPILTITLCFLSCMLVCGGKAIAQTKPAKRPWYNLDAQLTYIYQAKPRMASAYEGINSLKTEAEAATSLTSTVFLDINILPNLVLKINPELAGGSGLSQARGIAGFTNGETFRIGSAEPAFYLARGVLEYTIPLGNAGYIRADDHPLNDSIPTHGITIAVGKFSLMDYFDGNDYSHDPRDQFMNWSLMSSGAYDYSADTRGYTQGFSINYFSPHWEFAVAATQVPETANGPVLDPNLSKAYSVNLAIERKWQVRQLLGTARLTLFRNQGSMANYNLVTDANPINPTLEAGRGTPRTKYGFALSADQATGDNQGIFGRLSWNDGQNETWAFTEIDQSLALGYQGLGFTRQNLVGPDIWGIAAVTNGISAPHQRYLAAGGLGFIIGDGQLNYAQEMILEGYYKYRLLNKSIWLSPDVQLVINPGYNRDRGPAIIYGLRFHWEC